ncbi:MAG TPA: sigma 54-interacting transcriptional regulator [Burkholderiaceae bacterium]|nr:sigma 54-interacting transcriptional regulator [Burkholderiaceae bacterium]
MSIDSGKDWHRQEVMLIREVAKLVGRSLDPYLVIRQTLRLLSEWIGLNRGRVLLWDAAAEALQIRFAYGLKPEEIARGRFRAGEGICGSVYASGLPRLVQDIDDDSEFLARSVARGTLPQETVAFIALPLREGDRIVGVLAAHRLRARPRALDDDLEVLRTVATLIGQVLRVAEEVRLRTERLESENRDLRERLEHRLPNYGILGEARVLKTCIEQVERLSATDLTVLLLGESGTGKELFARAVHGASGRRDAPFVKVNCAAVPESLFESEFFGHERGAFTGAVSAQPGRFEQAHGGTLFLDEIGELPLTMQAKLLRVLQDRTVVRVGSRREIGVDVRVIAATNRNLAQAVARGQFRLDLYHRLSVLPLRLPALRERSEDIALLVRHFAHEASLAYRREPVRFSDPAMQRMRVHRWPGNVRQLQNVVARLVIMANGTLIDASTVDAILAADDAMEVSFDDVPAAAGAARLGGSVHDVLHAEPGIPIGHAGRRASERVAGSGADAAPALDDRAATTPPAFGHHWPTAEIVRPYAHVQPGEREHLLAALARAGGNRSRAAQILGMTRRQLTYRLQKLADGAALDDSRTAMRTL